MSTRLYLTSAAATFVPAAVRGTWNSAGGGASALTKFRAGSNQFLSVDESSATNNYRALLRRFISEPFTNNGTFDGNLTVCIAVAESSSSMNAHTAVHAYITVGNTNTVRGTLVANGTGAGEWSSDPIAQASTFAVTPVVAQAGDRLVIEVGFSAANTSTTTYTGLAAYGGTGSDLVPGGVFIPFFSSRTPWCDLTGADELFAPPARDGGTMTTTPSPAVSLVTAGKVVGGNQVVTSASPALSLPFAAKGLTVVTSANPDLTLVSGFRISSGLVTTEPNPTTALTPFHIGDAGLVVTEPSPATLVYLDIGGDVVESPPDIELFTSGYRPPTRKGLRFIVQKIRSGEWLDWDFPISKPEITWTLSGPTLIKGVLQPEFDLGYQLEAWADWVHVEEDGEIRASGVLQPGQIDPVDQSITIEAVGVAGYPNDVIFGGEISEIQVDPMDIVRRIWADTLGHPDAPDHVTIASTTSPIKLGKPSVQQVDENGVPQFDEETDSSTGEVISSTPRMTDPQPYELFWFNLPNSGEEIDKLAQDTAFDYAEIARWNTDKTAVEHHIDLGYPRLGRLRDDLRFAQDENLSAAVPLDEEPTFYASEVILKGAGEGRKGIYGRAAQPSATRIRVVRTIVDRSITDQARADGMATDDLRSRVAELTIEQITISDSHPNAPIGSYAVGDDITVLADIPFVGDIALRHRIISLTWRPDDGEVDVQMRRSEQFAYGRSQIDPTIDNVVSGNDSGGGGSPITYDSTSEALKLGTQNHFKLQVGTRGSSSSAEIEPAELYDGYSQNPEYILNSEHTAVLFRTYMDAGTTSGSQYPRTELREMDLDDNEIAFESTSGDNWIQADFRFTHLPRNSQRVVCAQIHDEDSDLIEILTRLVDGQLNLMFRLNGEDDDSYTLINNYQVGTKFKLRIRTGSFSGHAEIYVNDMTTPVVTTGKNGVPALDPKGKSYFKAGCYPQANDSTESSSDYAEVEISRLGHFHTGWPQPVFDPETTGGTPGGVFSMAFGACINADDSDCFTKIASLNPKYCAILGDLVYPDRDSGFYKAYTDKFNAPKLKAMRAKLPTELIYTWSDHDATGRNDGTGDTRPDQVAEANEAYRRIFTSLALPDEGIYHDFEDGRVKFVVLDEQTFKDVGNTILGSAQKDWLKDILASDEYPLIVLLGDTQWVGSATDGDNAWKGTPDERDEIGAACDDSPATIIRLSADMHCLAYGHDQFGIDRVWQAAPFKNNTKVKAKGEGYISTYPSNSDEGPVSQQFGLVTFDDSSPSKIVVTYRGYTSDGTQRLSDSITVNV